MIAAREVKPGECEVKPREEGLQQPDNAVRPADIGDKPKGGRRAESQGDSETEPGTEGDYK